MGEQFPLIPIFENLECFFFNGLFPFPDIGDEFFIPIPKRFGILLVPAPVSENWKCNFHYRFRNELSHFHSLSRKSKSHSSSPLDQGGLAGHGRCLVIGSDQLDSPALPQLDLGLGASGEI